MNFETDAVYGNFPLNVCTKMFEDIFANVGQPLNMSWYSESEIRLNSSREFKIGDEINV